MPNSLNLLGYSLAFLAYIFLLVLLVFSWRGRIMSSILIAATAISAAWAFLIARSVISEGLAVFIPIVELLKVAAWCFFLVKVIDLKADDGNEATPPIWTRRFYWFFFVCVVLLALVPLVVKFLGMPQLMEMSANLNPAVWISITIFGMVLVEQVFSTTSTSGRWSSKYLCLGLGGVFAYDFAMYADAMMFKHLDPNLWSARGLINTLAVPLIAVSIARNPRWELGIHVSRHMVFQSVTLLGAGIYLMLMATAGYLIRFYGGVWGSVLQIFFLAATGVLLVILLFSGTIRAKIRVYLSKHFFSYKYDYREEWSNFTRTLSKTNDDIPEQVIASVASLVSSPGGLLWAASDNGDYQLIANWNMPPPAIHPGGSFSSLVEFSRERDWVIDFDEYQSNPDKYGGLKLPDWLSTLENAWILLPLSFNGEIIGFTLLKRSDLVKDINWEDRDLLKICGLQAASYLAQHLSNQALLKARQFEAFNRLSAYVVHDLKNILAQQSLIVSNAGKHKHNPAFVDDVIATVDNSVQRMTRLMEQMRSGMRGTKSVEVDLAELLNEVVSGAASSTPIPVLEICDNSVTVNADREELATVFGHIIQNAQDATHNGESISVTLEAGPESTIVSIADHGCGMSQDFVRTRLFSPFDSTKGLTGMGVGAFESREYVRSLGGDIEVSSELHVGSIFKVVLPLAAQ